MKKPQRITRVQLKVNNENDSLMLGIVSTDADYKLSLAINKKLRISLKTISPVEFKNESGNDMHFSMFSDSAGTPDLIINLVSNRSGKNFLLKKLKNIDYILQLYDPEKSYNSDNLISKLREIESVTAVFQLDIKTLRDRNLRYLLH